MTADFGCVKNNLLYSVGNGFQIKEELEYCIFCSADSVKTCIFAEIYLVEGYSYGCMDGDGVNIRYSA